MIADAQAALRQQEQQEEQRRRKERNEAKQMAKEADVARARKARQKQEEFDNDLRMAKAQQELLEKQDRDRAAFFTRLHDKQSAMMKQYEAGVGNELARLAEEDDQRAKKQQRAVEQKEQARQDAHDRQISRMKEAGRVAVQRQLEEHEQ